MSRFRRRSRNFLAVGSAVASLALSAGCGDGAQDTVDPGSADAESALTAKEASEPLKATPELEAIRAEASEILDDGYEARIEELEGTPIVVNNWASWCGPCREEFPYFQAQAIQQGDEVAFLGLLSGDGDETGATFLDRFPTPYPSYLDRQFEISLEELNSGRRLPSTAFYDSSGELVYLKQGPYASEEDLAADIEKYAQ